MTATAATAASRVTMMNRRRRVIGGAPRSAWQRTQEIPGPECAPAAAWPAAGIGRPVGAAIELVISA